jgi:hypothetical protein
VLNDLATLHRKYGVLIVDPAAALCTSGGCSLQHDGKPLYVDHHHLSVFGARLISGLFAPAFADRQKPDLR